jgi:glycosyltransferase involved in cell wall biosynthesis
MCKLVVTAPSLWLTKLARQSHLGRFPVHHIPNGIDLTVFRPHEKAAARRELGLPVDKKILLWAASSTLDTRKGADLLPEIADSLPPDLRDSTVLVVFGGGTQNLQDMINMKVHSFGEVSSESKHALLYSAADVLVFPSRSDNLPFVPLEALGCALPAVGFDVGGVPELIVDGVTGLLVPAFDKTAFVNAVGRMLEDEAMRSRMSANARELAEKKYAISLMADGFLTHYEKALTGE